MSTLLYVQSSLYGAQGASSQLAESFVAQWLASNPGGRVIRRDLAADPAPHLTAERFQAFNTAPEARTPEQQAVVAYSDALIDELRSADTIVLGVPMYNFSVPSTLRTYFDHIARAGVTFRYTSAGPEGLLAGRRAYVFVTRGGVYGAAADTQVPYLRQFLGFIGIESEFVFAEGLGLGEESRRKSLGEARAQIAEPQRGCTGGLASRTQCGVEKIDRGVQRAQTCSARELGGVADEAVIDVGQHDQLRFHSTRLERRVEILRLTHSHSLVERAVDEQEWRIAAIDIADGTCKRDAVVRARARFASQVARHVRRRHDVLRQRRKVEDSVPGNDRLHAIRFQRGFRIEQLAAPARRRRSWYPLAPRVDRLQSRPRFRFDACRRQIAWRWHAASAPQI